MRAFKREKKRIHKEERINARGITGELTKLKNCDYVRVTALPYVMIYEFTKQKNVILANFLLG